MNQEGDKRPPVLDKVGKLCLEGKDVAAYLYQVPDDEGQRARLRAILDGILNESAVKKRKELPSIAQGLKEVLSELSTIRRYSQTSQSNTHTQWDHPHKTPRRPEIHHHRHGEITVDRRRGTHIDLEYSVRPGAGGEPYDSWKGDIDIPLYPVR